MPIDPNRELERLLALQQCRDVVVASARAVDAQDYAALAAQFTAEGELVRPDGQTLRGRDAIAQAYRRRDPDRLTRHLLTTHTLQWQGEGVVRSLCDVLLWSGRHSDAAKPQGRPADAAQQVGTFDDELVASAEGWRIRRRVAGFVLQRERAV